MPTTSPYLVLSLLDVLEGRCLFLTFALGLLPGSGSLPHSLPVFLGGWTHLCSAALENLECTWLYYSYCPVPMLQAQGLLWAPRPSAPCMVSGPGCQAQHNTVLMLLCKALLVSAGLQGLGGLTTCTRKAGTQRNSVCCSHSDSCHIVWLGSQGDTLFLLWGLAEAKEKTNILSHLPFLQ